MCLLGRYYLYEILLKCRVSVVSEVQAVKLEPGQSDNSPTNEQFYFNKSIAILQYN